MQNLIRLLTEVHTSLAKVSADLLPDCPELARALQAAARELPHPDELDRLRRKRRAAPTRRQPQATVAAATA